MPELLPTGFLFRLGLPIKRLNRIGASVTTPPVLGTEYELPDLGQLTQGSNAGKYRIGWHEQGLAIQVHVTGRKSPPKCDYGSFLTSDGLQLWVDTRNTQNIHRASKFCHHFAFLPSGHSRDRSAPIGKQIAIARAREDAPLCDSRLLLIKSEIQKDGYTLRVWIPAECLNGFAPDTSPHLGFYALIRDQELGDQYLSVGAEFPFDQDPSLWWTLDLTE